MLTCECSLIVVVDACCVKRRSQRMSTQARSIASLTISFGLVAIPVKLYSATVASERIAFNLSGTR